jgi:2-oxoglutarate ferredoxin oxidoreductase subunit delta
MRTAFFSRNHAKTKYIQINSKNCIACWECVNICSQKVIDKVDIFFHKHKHAHIDSTKKCIGCLRCVKACKNNAIKAIVK